MTGPAIDIHPTAANGASNRAVRGWLWAVGAALVVFAFRSREILLHGGNVPYLDQWRIEAELILVPWLQGRLSWTDFFTPHHEHFPVWTRLSAWLQAVLLGRWDAQLQCTLNAALWSGTVGLWCRWLLRWLPVWPAIVISALAVSLAALPHGWENSTWGFQIHFPLALLFVTWHIHGALVERPLSPSWWLAQGCGLAALFTLGSMWAAPFALLLVLLWTGDFDRRRLIPAACLTVLGLVLLVLAKTGQPHAGALAQTATSLRQFLAALLVQLGWPSQWPGVALLLHFPVLVLGWKIFRQPSAPPIDRLAVAIGLWAIAQAAAFALARGGSGWIGFVSRYGDLLALGSLANAVALWRLLHGCSGWRFVLVPLGLVWGFVFTQGLDWVSTRGHTEYFHQHSAGWSHVRQQAVRHYLMTGSPEALQTLDARNLLYPDPTAVARVLDTPGLTDLLPVSVRDDRNRVRGDFISAVATRLRELWPVLSKAGALLLLVALLMPRAHRQGRLPAPVFTSINPWPVLAGLTLTSAALLLLWPMPFEFSREARWQRLLTPPGHSDELSYLITTPTTYVVDNLTGGAGLWPENFRNTFYGTHIDGPAFTGSARSSTFPLTSPWLVIPIAGFPASTGNQICLRVEDAAGGIIVDLICQEPNPADIAFWQVDVREHRGRLGRILFHDGRADAEGWVAAAAPQFVDDARTGQRLNAAWKHEQTAGAHSSLGLITAALFVATCWSGLARWLHKR